MIYVLSKGGIGNIMFQAAAIQKLAVDNNDNFTILTSSICDPIFSPTGGNIHIPLDQVNSIFKNFKVEVLHRIKNKINIHPNFKYINIPYVSGSIYNGYFQHPNYVLSQLNYLKEIFHLDTTNAIKFLNKHNLLIDNTVTVHVRRGDYVKLGWAPSKQYYVDAMKQFSGLNFVFISNDINWCKKEFPGNYYSELTTDVDEMSLIMICNKRIISGSTFSWWPAILGDDEKTICPHPWIKKKPRSSVLILDKWTKLCI